MGIKCPKCQLDNPETATFCADCGTRLTSLMDISITKTIETPVEEYPRGTLFAGRYEIIEELGKGAMGAVYRVEDKKIGQEIALKLINPEVASDKKTIERFRNELKTTRMISHRNVCRMFDLSDAEGTHFITMEYIPGEDLKSFIRRVGQLPSGKAISIAKQVSEGLAEAHRLGVVHRDLKSSNIMIDKEGNARIMDFGIARSHRAKGLTGEGIIIGTPEYMSPEQAEAKEVDHRSDIYCLGVILYEMVTGKLPFEGDTPLSIAMKHKGEIPKSPKEMNPQVSEDLNVLILKCLEKEKESRFQSAEELYVELNNMEKELPTAEKVVRSRKPLTAREITVTFGLKKLLIPVLAAALLIVAAIIIWQLLPQKEAITGSSDKPTLAIMYFKNKTGNANLNIWNTALQDLLIADLIQSKHIRVISGDRLYSIMKQLNLLEVESYSSEDLKEVVAQGGASHILQGILTRAGDEYRINVTLQEAGSMDLIDSERVEGRGEESFHTMVDELTRRIKASFKLSEEDIAADIDENVGKITTSSTEAYKYYSEGMAAAHRSEYRQGIALVEKALKIDPEFAMAYLAMAKMYGALYINREKEKCYQKAFELSDRLPGRERYIIQGDFYKQSGNTLEAIDAYKKLMELYPEDIAGNIRLADTYSSIEEWDLAREHYEMLIQNKSESISPYTGLSFVYKVKGLYDKAIEPLEYYLNNISDNDSDNAYLHYLLALNYTCQGKLDLALFEVDKALALKSSDFNYFMLKGDVFHFKGELSRAEDEYQRLFEMEAQISHAMSFGKLATLYVLQGRFEEAKRNCRQVIEIGDKIKEKGWSASFIAYLGYLYLKSGNPAEALKKFEEGKRLAAEVNNSMWQRVNLCLKGQACLAMDSIDKAQDVAQELKEMIQKGQNRKLIREYDHLAGMIELEKENYPQAIQYFKEALSLLPSQYHSISGINNEHGVYLDSLALAYYRTGELDKAKEEYERITRLTTGRLYYGDIYAKSFYMLGKIYEEKGWEGKAIEQYEKFLDLWKNADPGFFEIDDARQRLTGLKQQ